MVLGGRTDLRTIALQNCDGLSEGLFPRWCNRSERSDEAEVHEQLDQVLMSSLSFGHILDHPGKAMEPPRVVPTKAAMPRTSRRRQHPRCPSAQALRSITSFSLGGAAALVDRSADALAELLHDAQLVDLRGCSLLTEDSLRSFRKGCKYLRSVSIVTNYGSLSWNAATSSTVKKHRRKSSFYTSGSSGTESN